MKDLRTIELESLTSFQKVFSEIKSNENRIDSIKLQEIETVFVFPLVNQVNELLNYYGELNSLVNQLNDIDSDFLKE